MSLWDEHNFQSKIIDILSSVQAGEHHFGRPYVTAYQLAIEFQDRHSGDVQQLGLQVGGQGTGERTSLAQYLARELSRRIKAGTIPVEGAFLSNQNLGDISFDNRGAVIHSSLTEAGYPLSMFRLRDRRGG